MARRLMLVLIVATLGLVQAAAVGAQSFPLDIRITLDRFAYEPGMPINFTIRVTNVGPTPVTYAFGSSQRFDVVIHAGFGEIARWSTDRTFTPSVPPTQVRFEPGVSQVFTDQWYPLTATTPGSLSGPLVQPLTPALYEIHAELANIGTRTPGRTELLFIGRPIPVDAGCHPLMNQFPSVVATSFFIRAVEPPGSVQAVWRYDMIKDKYLGFTPGGEVASDLLSVMPGDQLVLCTESAGRILVPAR